MDKIPTTAPETVALRVCPVCGRNDRFVAFTGKSHFVAGERCKGKLITCIYALERK